MAITIQQEPISFTPAYNENIFVISSTNNGEANFKYVIDVIVNGQTNRLKLFPHPSYGTAYVDVGRIVENYISSDIDTATYGFQRCENSYEEYEVQFGEQYGNPVTVYPNLTSTSKYVWNANIDFLQFQNYDGNGYLFEFAENNPYLTNQPINVQIRDDDNAWVYGVTPSSGAINTATIVTYDSSDVAIQTVRVQNPYTDSDVFESKMMRFGSGTKNLNLIPSSGITLGAQPIITSSVAYYEVYFAANAPIIDPIPQTYTVENACTENDLYRFHFLNQRGGFDSFTFYRAAKKRSGIRRQTYKKKVGGLTSANVYGYDVDARSTIAYNTEINDSISVNSDWIDEATNDWLEELISSPEVYLEETYFSPALDANTTGLVSVNITNPSYDFKQELTDKLFNLTINYTPSYNRLRQRY